MSHGVGVTAALRNAPDAVVVLFALVTQLGDVWFYLVALTIAYGFSESLPRIGGVVTHARVAFVIAVALGAIALTTGLKELLMHPRPPGAATARELAWLPSALVPIWENISTADGFSLPSGHATGSAAIYGAAALVIPLGRRRARYAAIGLIVGIVAASRVVTGVHYVGDVVVGVLVGGAYLTLVWWTTQGMQVKRAFSIALAVALVSVVVHFGVETTSALGGAVGGRLTWTIVGGRLPDGVSRQAGAVATLFGLVVAGAFVVGGLTVETPVAGFLTNAFAIAAVLTAPLVGQGVAG